MFRLALVDRGHRLVQQRERRLGLRIGGGQADRGRHHQPIAVFHQSVAQVAGHGLIRRAFLV